MSVKLCYKEEVCRQVVLQGGSVSSSCATRRKCVVKLCYKEEVVPRTS